MSLKDEAKKMNLGNGVPFMEGRTKGSTDELLGKEITIRDFAFLNGQDGEYVVFIIDEDKDSFYFGGSVLTNNMKAFSESAQAEIRKDGLKTVMNKAQSKKSKRNYISVKFLFDDEDDLPF